MMTGAEGVRYSEDMGKSWSPLASLSAPIQYAIRLKSGKLGAHHKGAPERDPGTFYTSEDEGKSEIDSKCLSLCHSLNKLIL